MISIVIPAYNEESAIGATIETLSRALLGRGVNTYEIIVVDDGSDDRTAERAMQSDANVAVVTHPHNVGYGRSLKTGIETAKYDTIVITDADGTYPLNRVPDLLEMYHRGYDLVVGARSGEFYEESIVKSPLRRVLRALVEFTADRKIPDINSGFRVFNRDTTQQFASRLCDTFSFTTSQTLAYMMNGKFVGYIDIDYYERRGDSKVRLFWDSLRTLQYIIEAVTYYNPLKIFTLLSLLCLAFAFVSIVAALILQLASLFALGVGSILLAIMMLGIGLLAVLLKQIMDTGNHKSSNKP